MTANPEITQPIPDKDWSISCNASVLSIANRIRLVVEDMRLTTNTNKPLIKLSIGDPTVFGHLDTHPHVRESIVKSVMSRKYDGYAVSSGTEEAKLAVAQIYNNNNRNPNHNVTAGDVYITNGCSEALLFAIRALASPGQNILCAVPVFSLYWTISKAIGIEYKTYKLLEDKGWEVDLCDMENNIDRNTAAIIVNNPSNPCGAVYSKQHMLDIINLAEKYRLPIIADEVYYNLTFKGVDFYFFSDLSTKVPIISCAAISKRYLVPGWRLGWCVVHNRQGVLNDNVRTAIRKQCTVILGACHIVQGALPDILNTPQSFFDDYISKIEASAIVCYTTLLDTPGLTPIKPRGGMFMMAVLDYSILADIEDSVDFTLKLSAEESVQIMPGKSFDRNDTIRICTCCPENLMLEAAQRITDFCKRHAT